MTSPLESADGDSSLQKALRIYAEQAPMPFAITLGPSHNLAYANASFCRLVESWGTPALATPIAETFGADEGRIFRVILDRAFHDCVELRDETIVHSTESALGWRCSVWPVVNDAGQSEGLGIEIRDASPMEDDQKIQRQVAERMLLGALRERGIAENAEAGRRRAAFLAEASHLLAQSVDQASVLVALTKMVLPTLDAWCIVDLVQEGGSVHRLGIYHPDPDKQSLARQLETTWFPEADDPFGAPAMLRNPKTVVINKDIDVTLATTAHTPENLLILRQLGIGALISVPLVARQRLLGAITFVSEQSGSAYTAEEIQLAEDLAARGALALDNAQVYDLALVLKRSAETANRAKTAFLGAMSHELRTPLNAIGGYIELLDMGLRGPVTDAQHADFARVRMNQQHLTLLITEILNFVRVGGGNSSYASVDVNARDALTRALELVEPLIAQRGIEFEGIIGPDNLVAVADPERVTQILVNLLSNAIKFTPASGRIGMGCAEQDDTVMLHVNDTGVGIPSGKLEAIFEPFIQLKEGLANKESGIGLGLAISRDLARAMKGDLLVESSEGRGTRFTLVLPQAEREAAAN